MKESLGGTSGVDKFKGFVGSPEYGARQAGLEQLKKLTPKELGNNLMVIQAGKEHDNVLNKPKKPPKDRTSQKVNYGMSNLRPGEFVEELEKAERQLFGKSGRRLK